MIERFVNEWYSVMFYSVIGESDNMFIFLCISNCVLLFFMLQYTVSQRGFMGTIADDYNRQHSVNRRKSPAIAGDHAEAYRRVMSTWPSLMVGTAEVVLSK